MFIASLENIVPWMFSLDHVHYSRWMPIFIQNLKDLKLWHNDIYEQFLNGDFTMVKSLKKFSAIAEDQAHEQNNKLIQAEGGAIGIRDSKDALMKWMIAGPEMADITYNYNENNSATEYESEYQHHHEHTKSFEEKFRKNVTLLTGAFKEMGNVFEEIDDNLSTIKSKILMDDNSKLSVRNARLVGITQYKEFIKERFVTGAKSVHDVIKQNKLSLFRRKLATKRDTGKVKETLLKQDCHLFSSLFIAFQTRKGDLGHFFMHENRPYPPALSNLGEMRHNNKSDVENIFK